MTSIARFLKDTIGLRDPALEGLERLEGNRLTGNLDLRAGLDAARELLKDEVPVQLLPIGWLRGELLCAHLRPSDVARGKLTLVRMDSDRQVTGAGSFAHVLVSELAYEEVSGSRAAAAAGKVNAAMGRDLYRVGENRLSNDDDAVRLARAHEGGSVSDWSDVVVFEGDAARKRERIAEACAKFPDWLYFQSKRAAVEAGAGRTKEAAEAAAAGLACYFHTAGAEDPEALLDRARDLAKKHPETFRSETAQIALAYGDLAAHEKRTRAAKDLASVEKSVSDLAWLAGGVEQSLPVLRGLYDRLGWKWALALCDLRS